MPCQYYEPESRGVPQEKEYAVGEILEVRMAMEGEVSRIPSS